MSKEKNPLNIPGIVIPFFSGKKAIATRNLDVIRESDREAITTGVFTFIQPKIAEPITIPVEQEAAPFIHPLVERMTPEERRRVVQRINRTRFPRIEPEFKGKDWELALPEKKRSIKKSLLNSVSPLAIAEASPLTSLGTLMYRKYDVSTKTPELNEGMSYLGQACRRKYGSSPQIRLAA